MSSLGVATALLLIAAWTSRVGGGASSMLSLTPSRVIARGGVAGSQANAGQLCFPRCLRPLRLSGGGSAESGQEDSGVGRGVVDWDGSIGEEDVVVEEKLLPQEAQAPSRQETPSIEQDELDVTGGGTMGLSTEQLRMMKKLERRTLRERAGITTPSRGANPPRTRTVEGEHVSGADGGLRQIDAELNAALQEMDEEGDEGDTSSWMSDVDARRHEHVGKPGGAELAETEQSTTQVSELGETGSSARLKDAGEEAGLALKALDLFAAPVRSDVGGQNDTGSQDAWWERSGDEGLIRFMTDPALEKHHAHLTAMYNEGRLQRPDDYNHSTAFLTAEEQAEAAQFDAQVDDMKAKAKQCLEAFSALSTLWGGDRGRQLAPPAGQSACDAGDGDVELVVGGPGGFADVSTAVNTSWAGQGMYIRAGTHAVGDALAFLGLSDDEEQLQLEVRPETLVVNAGWTLSLRGEPPSPPLPGLSSSAPAAAAKGLGMLPSQVVGSWVLDEKSEGNVSQLCLTHCGGLNKTEHELPRGGGIGEISLVHVMGHWSFLSSTIAFGGGHGLALLCDTKSKVDLSSCRVGGLDLESEGEGTAHAERRARERVARDADQGTLMEAIMFGREERCANAVSALFNASVSLRHTVVCHAWNAGVNVMGQAAVTLNDSAVFDVGYGVGLEDNGTATLHGCRIDATVASATASASRVGAIYVAANSHASSLHISNTHVSGPLWLGPKRPSVFKRRGLRGDFSEEAEEEPGEEAGQALIGREEHVAQVRAELESLEQVQKELSVIDEEVMKWIASHGS